MSHNGKIGRAPLRYGDTIVFKGFEVSWAGPFYDSMCFGSEDGRLRFTTPAGVELGGTYKSVSDSQEAINGLATIGYSQAVSTRADVTFMWNQFVPGGDKKSATLHSGAHGVVGTQRGYFVAPMARLGLMIVEAKDKKRQDVFVSNDAKNPLYFYRTIALPTANHNDVLVSAVRTNGIAAGEMSEDARNLRLNTITPHEIDVVDICGLGRALAVAALGRNGTVMLFHDILRDTAPRNLKFRGIEGVAYRLMSARGHIFVLTSKGFYVLANLAKRFLDGEIGEKSVTQIMAMKMCAVDANVFKNEFVYIVNDESSVFRIDLSQIERVMPKEEQKEEKAQIPVNYVRGNNSLQGKRKMLAVA